MSVIGERIKLKRIELGVSQAKLAKAVRIGRSTLAKIEAGIQHPTSDVINNIAVELNVSRGWLLGDPEPDMITPLGYQIAEFASQLTPGEQTFIRSLLLHECRSRAFEEKIRELPGSVISIL